MPNKKRRPAPPRPARKARPLSYWRRYGGYALLAAALLFVSLSCYSSDRGRATGEPWKEFSGANALHHVQGLVGLGPRPPESEAIKKARAYIRAQLEATGWQVIEQPFADADAARHGPVRQRDRAPARSAAKREALFCRLALRHEDFRLDPVRRRE